MAKGQRRYGPPPGYMTSTEAVKLLGKMLYKHVEEGRIRKVVPEGREHGYYHKGDVEAQLLAEELFTGRKARHWKDNPTSTFELATEADMPAIVEISRAIFGDSIIPVDVRLVWMRKNPESFFVLRNQAGTITGYTSMFPVKRDVLNKFIHDEIAAEDITVDDVLTFEPDQALHLYVMAIGIDPQYPVAKKHEYGARLVTGLYNFLLQLARRGVEIETITARSHKTDGLRLLRKMGIPQLRSPVPAKALFMVRPAESGFPLFVQYSEILEEWKATHQPHD